MQQGITDQREWLDRLEIGVVDGSEREDILGVLSRGSREYPLGSNANPDFSHALVARSEDGSIVGVCCMSPPGGRVPRSWQGQNPYYLHWHVGPLGVEAHLQGMGLEDRLMCVCCVRMDAARDDAYLETVGPENVRFYERFGFEVAGEHEVLGARTCFMVRRVQRRNE